jgi:signal transduction histidine kinase
MIFQFVAGMICAIVISPRAWAGSQSHVHLHVWAALGLGGLIASVPVLLAAIMPGRLLTRCTIAAGQMMTSALLIHLTGGRIETHFHVFGSLAFLAFYRDWRVFIPATIVVETDHLVRGLFWPESVYGVLTASPWRSLEDAGWVLFEEAFLIGSCLRSVHEMKEIAQKRAQLENTNAVVEEEVRQRTSELNEQATVLRQEIDDRRRAESEREAMHRRLVEVSRQAGMSEVATGVLHNVGNVLNSVNVSAGVVTDKVRQSDAAGVAQIAAMLRDHADDLGSFLTRDERGRLIPTYLAELGAHLAGEQETLLGELQSLTKNVEHIKEIVAMQQTYAKVSSMVEAVRVEDVIEDAIRINSAGLQRHGMRLVREFAALPPATVDRTQMLQILVNLISNAKYAVSDVPEGRRALTLRTRSAPHDHGRICIDVIDNGIGIAPENLTRIFSHGFTTRRDGHGFGLHSASLAAKAMGGDLQAISAGPGMGSQFTLELPLAAENRPAQEKAAVI